MKVTYNNQEYNVIATRRRYGRQFYTWIRYYQTNNGECIGREDGDRRDPYPCLRPKNSELIKELEYCMAHGKRWRYKHGQRVFF